MIPDLTFSVRLLSGRITMKHLLFFLATLNVVFSGICFIDLACIVNAGLYFVHWATPSTGGKLFWNSATVWAVESSPCKASTSKSKGALSQNRSKQKTD